MENWASTQINLISTSLVSEDASNQVKFALSASEPSDPEPKGAQEQKPNEHIVLEYLNQNPYDLSYTCLMIPRVVTHYLIGDIFDALPVEMKRICSSSGWSLEYLNIKADHIQWTVRVAPTIAAGTFMRTIREQTSSYIYKTFQRFKSDSPAVGDFWAPGYLVILGAQPHPPEMVKRFIRFTRQHQGIKVE